MKNGGLKKLLMPAVVLFAICLVSTALLALTNKITAPRIADLALENENKALAELLAEAKTFQKKELELDGEPVAYYIGLNAGGETAGYVFTTSATGYSSDIKVMTALDNEGKVVKISILQIAETPGLGMNALKEDFLNRFAGKSGFIGVAKSDPKESEIQAMTGATITSKAVTATVNKALVLFDAVRSGSQPGSTAAQTTTAAQTEPDTQATQPSTTKPPETTLPVNTNPDLLKLIPGSAAFSEEYSVAYNGKDYACFTGYDTGGKPVGYVVYTSAPGLEGLVEIATGFDLQGVITGVDLRNWSDREGRGMVGDSYFNLYTGLPGSEAGSVDAVSQATVTSDAVNRAVKTAYSVFGILQGGN